MQVSLFYFGSDVFAESSERYRLLLEGARFADENGLTAVWTPERHFDRFGGLYPNPCITSAALASITKKIRIRAGSSIQPFHNAVCMAENWALLDNLSNGRMDVAFGSGWHANDFVLAPEHYAERREILFRDIEVIRSLWRGDSIELKNGVGKSTSVRTYPPPIQKELPIWITAHSDETFRRAGCMGFNVLTNSTGKTNAILKMRIQGYLDAIACTAKPGHVTLMVHAFVSKDREQARGLGLKALAEYLVTSLELDGSMLATTGSHPTDREAIDKADAAFIAERAALRIIDNMGLIGTPSECREKIAEWEALGVNEVACLVDFGITTSEALAQLPNLLALT